MKGMKMIWLLTSICLIQGNSLILTIADNGFLRSSRMLDV